MSYAFDDHQRNLIDGEWHRIRQNAWTYSVPRNIITTWCGKTADEAEAPIPYMVIGRIQYKHVEKDRYTSSREWPDHDCAACAKAAWEHDMVTLMAKKP